MRRDLQRFGFKRLCRMLPKNVEQKTCRGYPTLVFQGPAKLGSFLVLILAQNGNSAKRLLFQGPGRSRLYSKERDLVQRFCEDPGEPLNRSCAGPGQASC